MTLSLNKEQVVKLIHRVWKHFDAVPTLYQIEVILAIVFEEHSRIVILKARGIGISFAIAFGVLLKALLKRGEYIIVAQDKNNSEHILAYIQDFYKIIATAPIDLPKIVNTGKDYLRFNNSSKLYSKSSEPNALRGLHGLVYWDETAFTLQDEDMRKAINGCLRPNYPFIISSTPNEQAGVFYETWTKGTDWKKYELDYKSCNIPLYIENVEKDKQRALAEGWYEDWLQEYACKFIDGSTRLFTWDLISSHIERERSSNVKTEYAGADFGKKIDQSVYHEIGKDRNNIIRVMHTHEFDFGADYDGQINVMIEKVKSNKSINAFYVDSTGVGVKLLEDLDRSDIGYLTKGITFSNSVKEKMVMYLYSQLLQDKILLPNDKKLTKQMHGIKRTKTDNGLNRYKHEDGKHDDSFWALCLALNGYADSIEGSETSVISTSGESKYKKHMANNTPFGRSNKAWTW